MSPTQRTPVTPGSAKNIENYCLKLRKAAMLAISIPSATLVATPKEEAATAQRHHDVAVRFVKLLHCEGYSTHGAAFLGLHTMYEDIRSFIEQIRPENSGFANECQTILLSDLYANSLIPFLECMIDYLRTAGRPGQEERGTFETLGDAIAQGYARRCSAAVEIGGKDSVTVRRERREAELKAKRASMKAGWGGKDEVAESQVAVRADSVVDVDMGEMRRPLLAEVVFRELRCVSPAQDESAYGEMV